MEVPEVSMKSGINFFNEFVQRSNFQRTLQQSKKICPATHRGLIATKTTLKYQQYAQTSC